MKTANPPAADAKQPPDAKRQTPLTLLNLLRSYVSDDDVELSTDDFLRMVADRINEDLDARHK